MQASLTRVQGFSLMVTTHNSTALKENGITEDIFIKFRAPARLFIKLNVIISIHSPNQEVLEYPQKYALILQVQKLNRVPPANNTGLDFFFFFFFKIGIHSMQG